MRQERWVFTDAELAAPAKCKGHDEFTTGPVPCGPPDTLEFAETGELRWTELGVFVQRNGTVTNRWDDGTAGVPVDIVDLAGDIDSYVLAVGEVTIADNWRDVICTSDGDFVRFADGTS